MKLIEPDTAKEPHIGNLMTDLELMVFCLNDAKSCFKALVKDKDAGNLDGRIVLDSVSRIAVELFNFRSERAGYSVLATHIPEDDIPF